MNNSELTGSISRQRTDEGAIPTILDSSRIRYILLTSSFCSVLLHDYEDEHRPQWLLQENQESSDTIIQMQELESHFVDGSTHCRVSGCGTFGPQDIQIKEKGQDHGDQGSEDYQL
ncbi:hypothetical protein ZIOFF_007949 [Zingiber officinale]|uniref:Uncharacterized protein n=1 Tax=Zingiber officinale TaxID=94328 RepID=A0A8J5HVE5_ZINOF|nr:hypothetical protein ZIOFF_007949 [Zingiber officinale]